MEDTEQIHRELQELSRTTPGPPASVIIAAYRELRLAQTSGTREEVAKLQAALEMLGEPSPAEWVEMRQEALA